MPLLVQNHLRSFNVRQGPLARAAKVILAAVGETGAELGITFVGDVRMRRLNCRYRGKDRSTDVLAFALREAPGPRPPQHVRPPLGDVVISVQTARRQARAAGRSLNEELLNLLTHGILHLCGYDHEKSEWEARRMHKREQRIMERLGKGSGLTKLSGGHR
jgi:rRNA maturation RNase YbeY